MGKRGQQIAVTEVREGSYLEPIRHLTWSKLRPRIGRLASAMRNHGIWRADCVAVVASHSVDKLTCLLAIASVEGLFSSLSIDMGVIGIQDRFLQIKPRYVFSDDWSIYYGRKINLESKIADVVQGMASDSEFEEVVIQP